MQLWFCFFVRSSEMKKIAMLLFVGVLAGGLCVETYGDDDLNYDERKVSKIREELGQLDQYMQGLQVLQVQEQRVQELQFAQALRLEQDEQDEQVEQELKDWSKLKIDCLIKILEKVEQINLSCKGVGIDPDEVRMVEPQAADPMENVKEAVEKLVLCVSGKLAELAELAKLDETERQRDLGR
jgi:hypothetical protein